MNAISWVSYNTPGLQIYGNSIFHGIIMQISMGGEGRRGLNPEIKWLGQMIDEWSNKYRGRIDL